MEIKFDSKILVVADREYFFLPHLVAKLARAGLISAIVIRRGNRFRCETKIKTLRQMHQGFGTVVLFKLAVSFLLASVCNLFFKHRYYSLEKVANRFGVRLYFIDKLHSDDFLNILAKEKASIVFSQCCVKVKKELLERAVFINRHCGLLPEYRGVNPVFWALLRGEKYLGVTLHIMNENYDEGPLLAQKRIPSEGCSFFSAYHHLFDETAELFFELYHKKKVNAIAFNSQGRYFSWQTAADRKEFSKSGKRYGFPFRFHPKVYFVK